VNADTETDRRVVLNTLFYNYFTKAVLVCFPNRQESVRM